MLQRKKWIIEHGRRRVWFAPWRIRCACGVAVYPCPALRMRAADKYRAVAAANRVRAARLSAAREWQAAERTRWEPR